MINEIVKSYCNEDISLIENFEKAIYDSTQTWECHHRRELETPRKKLIEIGEYYNRPASELIFLTSFEHRSFHSKGKPSCWKGKRMSEETRRKMSEAHKNMSEETKRKISIAKQGNKYMLGKHHSDETKKKLSEIHKGKQLTDETKKKLSIAKKGNKYRLGKHHSDESRKKMSIAKQGKHHSDESRKKMSESHKGLHWFNNGIKAVWAFECPEGFVKGRYLLEETRKRMAGSHKGKHLSDEHKRKVAESNRGKHRSDETKKKMYDSMKGRSWWNNGIKNVFSRECPEGFVKGRLKKERAENITPSAPL